MTKRKLEPDYWRNRDEWRLFSGRWWELFKKPYIYINWKIFSMRADGCKIIVGPGKMCNDKTKQLSCKIKIVCVKIKVEASATWCNVDLMVLHLYILHAWMVKSV
jgi:hypothetical protein